MKRFEPTTIVEFPQNKDLQSEFKDDFKPSFKLILLADVGLDRQKAEQGNIQ